MLAFRFLCKSGKNPQRKTSQTVCGIVIGKGKHVAMSKPWTESRPQTRQLANNRTPEDPTFEVQYARNRNNEVSKVRHDSSTTCKSDDRGVFKIEG
jgi:hypothetical protein